MIYSFKIQKLKKFFLINRKYFLRSEQDFRWNQKLKKKKKNVQKKFHFETDGTFYEKEGN